MRISDWSSDVCSSDLVVRRLEKQRGPNIDHRIARNNAAGQRIDNAFFHGRDEVARHRATLDRIHELEARTRWQRFDFKHHVAVLAASARLLDEFSFAGFADLANGFAQDRKSGV